MSAADFISAVAGPDEAAAVLDGVDAEDLLPRVALAWLRGLSSDFAGHLPGTSVPAALARRGAAWYGVLRGRRFEAAGENFAAAAVAAAVSPAGRGDAAAVAAVASTVDAVVAPQPQTLPVVHLAAARTGGDSAVGVATPTVADLARDASRRRRAAAGATKRRVVMIRVTFEDAARPCTVCGEPQVAGGDLVGCGCLRALVATAAVRRLHEAFLVQPGPDWGDEVVAGFREAVSG